MRKPLIALLVALLIPVLGVQSASADESRAKNSSATWNQLTADAQVWKLGDQIRVYECLARPTMGALSLKTSNGWIEVARTVAVLDPKLCETSSAPYAAKYEFVLVVDGQQDFPGTQAKLLIYKITYTQGPSHSNLLAAVYESSDELSGDERDGKLPGTHATDAPEQQTQTLASPKPIQPKSSVKPQTKSSAKPQTKSNATPLPSAASSAQTSVGWSGCSFNGVPMFGRVKFVSVGAQFKIRLIGNKAALKVKGVTRSAKSCGEWQFVSAAPAFTVEIVRTGEDFTVSLGGSRPGRN